MCLFPQRSSNGSADDRPRVANLMVGPFLDGFEAARKVSCTRSSATASSRTWQARNITMWTTLGCVRPFTLNSPVGHNIQPLVSPGHRQVVLSASASEAPSRPGVRAKAVRFAPAEKFYLCLTCHTPILVLQLFKASTRHQLECSLL
jgi:hypothetical protein